MTHDDSVAALFLSNFREAYRSARLLGSSFRRLKEQMPVTIERAKEFSEDDLDRLDAFRVRYCDLQDALGRKVFRSLLALEEERVGSQLDVLNMIDKRGIIASFEMWKELRGIRNLFSHDYPEKEEMRLEALNLAFSHVPQLLEVLGNVRSYVQEHVGLSMEEFEQL